ncbi:MULTISPECIES: hypothetical protein [unclassified Schlesneria]|uniref:hypothetical protein n=1 Tax=unclassified Schlesneria TaxID=2762017 RepID=UPI002EE7FFA5
MTSAKGLMMKTPVVIAILALAAALPSGSSTYAYDNWYGAGGLGGMYGGYGGYGGFGWGWGGAAGGVGQIYSGMGNLVRAEGQRNVLDSQAEINLQKALQENEKARTLHLENQQKIHAEKLRREREAKARNNEDRRMAIESRARQQQFLEAHRPQPLPSSQLDPASGTIHWPTALRNSIFDEGRQSIESMLEKFTKYGPTNDLTMQIGSAINELKTKLRGQILAMSMPEYTESRQFLDSLAESVR